MSSISFISYYTTNRFGPAGIGHAPFSALTINMVYSLDVEGENIIYHINMISKLL